MLARSGEATWLVVITIMFRLALQLMEKAASMERDVSLRTSVSLVLASHASLIDKIKNGLNATVFLMGKNVVSNGAIVWSETMRDHKVELHFTVNNTLG